MSADAPEQPREVEGKLLIYSNDPGSIVRRVSELTEITSYPLLPGDPENIRDVYFETPDRALAAQQLALRIREVKSGEKHSTRITLKGPSRQLALGVQDKMEIEEPWSEEALSRITRVLRDSQVDLPRPQPGAFEESRPLEVMKGYGLEVIQDRETYRQIRNVVRKGEESGPRLAELAIDTVKFSFGGSTVNQYEVEIEAKSAEGADAVPVVCRALVEIYGRELREWEHSKLAMGMAIEQLLSTGALDGLLDESDNLMPEAYRAIADYFSQGEA